MSLPNKISVFRLALIPIFIVCYLSGFPNGYYHLAGGILFGVAAISDALDGWIARRYNMITPLGRLLDPMADKLLALSALLCLAIRDRLSYLIFLLYALKELFMLLGGVLILSRMKDVPSSNLPGKIVSALLAFTTFLFILLPEGTLSKANATYIHLGLFGLTILSFIRYILLYKKVMHSLNSTNPEAPSRKELSHKK